MVQFFKNSSINFIGQRKYAYIVSVVIIVAGINLLIDLLAYETCLYLTLKKEGILVDTSSEWTILLFFKNILVIPFTLVFETVFLLWVTNKLANRHDYFGEAY